MATGPTTTGSLHSSSRTPDARLVELRGAYYDPAPGEPGYLFHRLFGWLKSRPGGQKLTMKAANWQIPDRTGRDGRRAIGQDQPPMADPADFRSWVTSFNGDEGWAVPVDRRQPEVEAIDGSPWSLAIDQSRDYLAHHLDRLMLGGGTSGINASTITNEVATLTPGTAGGGPLDATSDPWSDPDADIEGQLLQCIDAYQRERGVRPTSIALCGSAVLAAQQNNNFRPITERVGGTGLALDSFGRLGLRNVYVGIDGLGLAIGTVVVFREEGPDPSQSYRPFVASWHEIADYTTEMLGNTGLGVGVHMWSAQAGSIDYARVATPVDYFYDATGIGRILNVLS